MFHSSTTTHSDVVSETGQVALLTGAGTAPQVRATGTRGLGGGLGAIDAQALVAQFHNAFGLRLVQGAPAFEVCDEAHHELVMLRTRLLAEEVDEVEAALVAGDRVNYAQELADVVYVAYGNALAFGVRLGDVDELTAARQVVWQLTAQQLVERLRCQALTASRAGASRDPRALQTALTALVASVVAVCERDGLPLAAVLCEVHRANMSKLGADGRPVLRADGKVLKGPNFAPADVAAVLALEGRWW